MARTNDDLVQLLGDLESDQVERKEALSSDDVRDRVRQAICAFANDMPGYGISGVVFIGVDDAGRVAGLDVTDRLLLTLSDMRSQGRILPPPTMYVRRLETPGGDVAVIEVEPSLTPPVRYDGRVWIRVGPRRALATAEEERRLAERRRAQDLPFDSKPVTGATLDDLDLSLFERDYLPAVLTAEVLAMNGRDVNQRLTSLRLATVEGTPTVAGVLILGKEPTDHLPGAYVQFLRIDGPDLSCPVIDEKRFNTALPTLLSAMDDYLKISVRTTVDIGITLRDRRSSDYPLAALQQLTRNAIMHLHLRRNQLAGQSHLVFRQGRNLLPGWPLRRCHGREFWSAWDYRLPQSTPRRGYGEPGLRPEIRRRIGDHARDAEAKREPTAGVHC